MLFRAVERVNKLARLEIELEKKSSFNPKHTK